MASHSENSNSNNQHQSNQSTISSDLIETAGDFTGKYLVLFRPERHKDGVLAIQNAIGSIEVSRTSDYNNGEVIMEDADRADIFVLDELSVAVVRANPDQLSSLQSVSSNNDDILAVEAERLVYAFPVNDRFVTEQPVEYLRGYKDAVNHLWTSLTDSPNVDAKNDANKPLGSDSYLTWGLQATQVNLSHFTGRGIRVAILDTGFDLDHPDFHGRNPICQSFIQGEDVHDLNGHGTHCIGTALGFRQLTDSFQRYGCAYNGEIYVGKVLSNRGSGSDQSILAGINWAIQNQCRIISMSLGSRTQPGEEYSKVYEAVAQRALQSNPGTLIIAAAGNDSRNITTRQRNEP